MQIVKDEKAAKGIMDITYLSPNEGEILNFLKEINSIPYDNSEKWEKKILNFFSKPFVIGIVERTLDKDSKLDELVIKYYFDTLTKGKVVIWNSSELYKTLNKIYEETQIQKEKLNRWADYFFVNNSIVRKMTIKRTDEEDSSFHNYGGKMMPYTQEFISDLNKQKFYQNYYILISDKSIDINFKSYLDKLEKDFQERLDNQLNKKKNNKKKRNPLDTKLRHEVFKRDNYKCKECGATKDEITLHADHILPVSQGGADELENLQTLCEKCNLAKSDKHWKSDNEIR